MLDDKYWMDIGGMKSLGGGGDFLPFRRLEASIRSASPNRVTRVYLLHWGVGNRPRRSRPSIPTQPSYPTISAVETHECIFSYVRPLVTWWTRLQFHLIPFTDSSTKERVHFEPGLFDSIAGNTYSFFFFSIHNYIKERNNFVDSIRVINILSL